MTPSNNQTDLCYASATALAADIRRGERSPVAVVDAFLDRIERVNPEINAYVTVCSESAREAAREAERAVERGDDIGPLHGVPVAIKDLNRVAGVRTTFDPRPSLTTFRSTTTSSSHDFGRQGRSSLERRTPPNSAVKPRRITQYSARPGTRGT